MRPTRLRVEHRDDEPLGIADATPRLSWWLPSGTSRQVRYQLDVDGHAFEPVESDRSMLVPWPAGSLGSRQRVTWRVRVWTDRGESDWSAPFVFETGLLQPTDWLAAWIEPREPVRASPGPRPAHELRHRFDLDDTGDARLYATAHGIYECFLNQARVGDVELAPGFTAYDHNLHVQTYDVTELVRPGPNEWTVVLSDGWYRGRTGYGQHTDCYGDRTAFLGQLHVGDRVIGTGPEWTAAESTVVAADLMAGQVEDRTRSIDPGSPVAVADHGFDHLTASPAPPTRRVQELEPVSVRRLSADRHIVDLGQNINGWVRLGDVGPAGSTTVLTHGEALDATGDVTQDHLAGSDHATGEALPVGQIDRVTAAGAPGEVFEPRHTTHGFQYVRVEGHPGPLTPDDVTGIVVHTDLRRTGWFRCSDDRVNRFHEATVWSFRDNACEIPTDCPQRERAGWTGDYQIFMPAATLLFDVAGFSLKWLRDLMADARPDGCVSNYAPDPARPKALPADDAVWKFLCGSAGWGDAMVIVPWALYRAYGDEQILSECWPAMRAWVDYAAEVARSQRHPLRAAERPEPAPHERYLLDGGFHWGEWLEPGDEHLAFEERFAAERGPIATAYLHRSAQLAACTARVLGHHAESERFEALAAGALDAWRAEYITADGSIGPETQANLVRALAFELVPETRRASTAERLVQLIREADTHLGTGFLATPLLLPALADAGHLDVAYELLLQDTPPSWLAMIERGATTVWESWEGLAADGTPTDSLNHFSKGAVVSFLYTHVAGVQQADDALAHERFRVAPRPGGGLDWAEAVVDSPRGRIGSAWRRDGDRFDLTVTVPPGTTAEVVLPDGTSAEVGSGTSTHTGAMR